MMMMATDSLEKKCFQREVCGDDAASTSMAWNDVRAGTALKVLEQFLCTVLQRLLLPPVTVRKKNVHGDLSSLQAWLPKEAFIWVQADLLSPLA